TRVSHSLVRYPLRYVTRSGVLSCRCAPICSDTSSSIKASARTRTASRRKSTFAPVLPSSSSSAIIKLVAMIGTSLRCVLPTRMEPDCGHFCQEGDHILEFTPLPGTLTVSSRKERGLRRSVLDDAVGFVSFGRLCGFHPQASFAWSPQPEGLVDCLLPRAPAAETGSTRPVRQGHPSS